MPKKYKYTHAQTGEVAHFIWDKPKPPTMDEASDILNQQQDEKIGALRKVKEEREAMPFMEKVAAQRTKPLLEKPEPGYGWGSKIAAATMPSAQLGGIAHGALAMVEPVRNIQSIAHGISDIRARETGVPKEGVVGYGPTEYAPGTGGPRDWNRPEWRRKLGGAVDIAGGALGLAAPIGITAGVAKAGLAPVAKGLAGFGAGAMAGQMGAEALGAPPEVSEAASLVVGGIGGGIGAKVGFKPRSNIIRTPAIKPPPRPGMPAPLLAGQPKQLEAGPIRMPGQVRAEVMPQPGRLPAPAGPQMPQIETIAPRQLGPAPQVLTTPPPMQQRPMLPAPPERLALPPASATMAPKPNQVPLAPVPPRLVPQEPPIAAKIPPPSSKPKLEVPPPEPLKPPLKVKAPEVKEPMNIVAQRALEAAKLRSKGERPKLKVEAIAEKPKVEAPKKEPVGQWFEPGDTYETTVGTYKVTEQVGGKVKYEFTNKQGVTKPAEMGVGAFDRAIEKLRAPKDLKKPEALKEAFKRKAIRGKSEKGAIPLRAVGPEKVKKVLGDALDVHRWVRGRVRQEGDAGKALMKIVDYATDYGEQNIGDRIKPFKYDTKLTKLSDTEAFKSEGSLLNIIEGRSTKPTSEMTAANAKQAKILFREMASEAIESGTKVTLASGEKVPFIEKKDYFPHIIPPIEQLKSGRVRENVIYNTSENLKITTPEKAPLMLDHFIEFIESGKPRRTLINLMVKDAKSKGQTLTEANALQQLLRYRKASQKKVGTLERAREINLPFYDPDPRFVIPQDIVAKSLRLSQIKHLGQEREVVNKLLLQIEKEGGDYEFVSKSMDKILSHINAADTKLARTARLARTYSGFKLSTAAVKNVSQGVLGSLLKGDLISTVRGTAKAATLKGRILATRTGANTDAILHEAARHAGAEGKALGMYLEAHGMLGTERSNRIVSANCGYIYTQRLLKQLLGGNKHAARRLEELGIDAAEVKRTGKVSPRHVLIAAKKFADLTQARTRPQDVPFDASSEWGKLFFQFKGYVYNQSRLVYESTWGEAKSGAYGRAMRNMLYLLTIFPAVGDLENRVLDFITGKKPEKDLMMRYLNGLASTGAGGVILDAIESGKYPGGPTKLLAGVTTSEVGEAIEVASQKHKMEAIGKAAFRKTPTIGRIFYHRLFDKKKKYGVRAPQLSKSR